MKILYVANIRLPTEKAHGIQIMQMCAALAAQGVDVELVVPQRSNPITENAFSYYGIQPSFKITYLPCLDLIRFESVGFALSAWSFLRAVRRYARQMPDAKLYSRDPLLPLYLRNAIVELHTRSGSMLVRRAARKARHIVAITAGLKQDIAADGVPAERITVLPDGVDLAKFDIAISRTQAREKLGLPQEKKIALYAGSFSLYSWKGVDVFLEAAKLLPDTIFLGVGGTTEEAERFVNPLPSNVWCVGHKPHNEIPLYLRVADVLVLPNKAGDPMSERYTSPLKLFEYMASGTPIVASDLPSIREIVDAASAVLVPAGDAQALARGCAAAMKAGNIADRARELAMHYSWGERAKRIMTLL